MIEKLVLVALSAIVSAATGYIISKLKQLSAANCAQRTGLQTLLRDRIISAYNLYVVDKKWIPIYAKEAINACFLAYENLGENGVMNDLMAQINALPNYPPCRKRSDSGVGETESII